MPSGLLRCCRAHSSQGDKRGMKKVCPLFYSLPSAAPSPSVPARQQVTVGTSLHLNSAFVRLTSYLSLALLEVSRFSLSLSSASDEHSSTRRLTLPSNSGATKNKY